MTKIPKIIHYCWFGGNQLPEMAIKCIKSWETYCPDYKIIRWDENNFDINFNRYVKDAYKSNKWAFVTDVVRLYVVYNFGGIYLDVDVELIKSLDGLLNCGGFIGFENKQQINTGLGFGAKKNHKIVYEILKDYDNINFIEEDGSFDLTTCPERNTKVLLRYGLIPNNKMQNIDDFVFLPTEYLCPKDYETGITNITDNTYSIHHFNASWYTEEETVRHRKIIFYKRIFGDKLGESITNLIMSIKKNGLFKTLLKILNK